MSEERVVATQEDAASTFALARDFYKSGDKSSNKCYYGSGGTYGPRPYLWSKLTSQINVDQGSQLSQRQTDRNAEILIVMQAVLDGRSPATFAGRTPYEIGEGLYLQNRTLGNCGEMAVVAMYLAFTRVHVPEDEITMWQLTNNVEDAWSIKSRSFGHSFAVLGSGKAAESWAVDPWAGLWCQLSDYSGALTEKLKYWTSIGKRIAVAMPGETSWVEPTNDMITGLLGKKVGSIKVGLKKRNA